MISVTVIKGGSERAVTGDSVASIAMREFGPGARTQRDPDEAPGLEYVTWTVLKAYGKGERVVGEIVAPPEGPVAEMSKAAQDAIASAVLAPLVFEHGSAGARAVRWERDVRVDYEPADSSWRPAWEGETCSQGGGGHSEWKTTACKAPAVVTRESMRGNKPYRSGRCEVHAGGRLPLEDGRVIEPVSNPLGGA